MNATGTSDFRWSSLKPRGLAPIALLAIAYFALAKLGLSLAFLHRSATPVWPPTGFSLAILLAGGPTMWPAIFFGAFFVNLSTTGAVVSSLGIAAGNALEGIAGVYLITRFAGGIAVFDRAKNVAIFALIAAPLCAAVSATIGVISLCLQGLAQWSNFPLVWGTWWLGDAWGALIFAPFFTLWARQSTVRWNGVKVLEAILLLSTLILIVAAVFGNLIPLQIDHRSLGFACIPLVVWTAFRFGQRETATVSVVLSGFAVFATLNGLGPFVSPSMNESLLLLQAFLALLTMTGMLVGASVLERTDTEAILRNREAEYRRLVETTNEGIWVVNREGITTYVNQRMAELLGAPAHEIVGGNALDFIFPDDRDKAAERLKRRDRGIQEQLDLRLRRRDGSPLWALFCSAPLIDSRGNIDGGFSMVTDISDRKLAEHGMLARADQLADADRRKDEFLAMLAHELRNPLSAISSALQLNRRAEAAIPPASLTSVIERQVDHLSRLIDDLMDVSRITRGKIHLHTEPLTISSVIERAVESVRHLVRERGHTITIHFEDNHACVLADPVRLEQMLINLLTNAIKYTEQNGTITVTARRDGTMAVITVTDNGMGIAPEMLARIFELFCQSERLLDRADGGLGIGLTLVKSLAEMHGGNITASSAGIGKGSTFSLRIPLLDGAVPRPGPAKRRGDAPAGKPLNVLVVDDNLVTAWAISSLLQGLGHTVKTAADGQRALELAALDVPDVVLLDLGLPILNGFEVATKLRGDARTHKAVIIAISGYGQEEDRLRSKNAGFDHHLLKPINFDELLDLIAHSGLAGAGSTESVRH